jgi:hypothetical protein
MALLCDMQKATETRRVLLLLRPKRASATTNPFPLTIMKTDIAVPPGQETPSPGPWNIDKVGDHIIIYSRSSPVSIKPVCEVTMWNDADARLIASAPELLAALKAFLTVNLLDETALAFGTTDDQDAANEAREPAIEMAKAAIARVEGREL